MGIHDKSGCKDILFLFVVRILMLKLHSRSIRQNLPREKRHYQMFAYTKNNCVLECFPKRNYYTLLNIVSYLTNFASFFAFFLSGFHRGIPQFGNIISDLSAFFLFIVQVSIILSSFHLQTITIIALGPAESNSMK